MSEPAAPLAVPADALESVVAVHGADARRKGRTYAALGWMTVSSVLFGAMNVLGRMAGARVPWQMVGATRAAVGVLVAFAVVRAQGAAITVRGSRALWFRSIFGTMALALTFYVLGSPGIALGDAATIFNLGPVFLAVLAPIVLGERTGRRLLFAIPLALAGVVLVAKPPSLFHGHAPSDPHLLSMALLAALFASLAMLGLRRVGPTKSPATIALHFSLVATLALGALAVPVWVVPSPNDLAMMVGAGVCAGIAQIAMTRAYTLERAARVASYGYLNVVFTAVGGAIVFGERPDLLAIFGMVLVVSGGLLVTVAGLREERV